MHIQQINTQCEVQTGKFKVELQAVSYTHLDVYKRQILKCK